jgi:hypothetical protein
MPDDPVDVLTRWEDHGALWRVEQLRDDYAVVQMCTCFGEPVERLESSDPSLIEFLRSREPPAP